MPAPRLVVFGPSPVALALQQLGAVMGYSVVEPGDARPGAFAIVATMGESDEESVQKALALAPEYLAVVASRKRFAQVRETLLGRGDSAAVWAFLTDPHRVAKCLPGAAITDKLDEKTYNGTMTVKVGPISSSYRGKVVFELGDSSGSPPLLWGFAIA